MATATESDPQLEARVAEAIDLLAGRRVAVLTGAGVSTDSGIPDYRGQGAPVRRPMTFDQFLADDSSRRRYWVGSHLGWKRFAAAEPNAGHEALARLEHSGAVTGVVTQNVDGLHLRAGSSRVVELHGTMRRVICLHCGQVFDRRDLAERIETDNPWIVADSDLPLGPDGDVAPATADGFRIPTCSVCEGALKPTSCSSASTSRRSASAKPSRSCAAATHSSSPARRSSSTPASASSTGLDAAVCPS